LLDHVQQPVEIRVLDTWYPESSAIIAFFPIAIFGRAGYGWAMYIRRTTIKSRPTAEPY
jgi:hypothetical protein